MPEGLDKLAGAIGDTLKTAPTLYEDALQPTVQEVGKFVSRIPRAINAAFSGLDKWILNKEYAIDETKKLLAQKLANVDPDKIVAPETYVAIPAIQAISYSMNSKELRNLYANLLAKSMNSDTKDSVHPSFVEIIRQMSPLDAKIFNYIMNNDINPCVDVEYGTSSDGYIFKRRNITNYKYASILQTEVSIDNLQRLNLISMPPHTFYLEDSVYDEIMEILKFITFHPKEIKPYIRKKQIEKTDYGLSFYDICVKDL